MDEESPGPSAEGRSRATDRIRVEKADGQILEYRVRGLRLGLADGPGPDGASSAGLTLEAAEVVDVRARGRDADPPSPFDHVALRVRDLAASRDFYRAALAPLGLQPLYEVPGAIGMGSEPGGRARFWLQADEGSRSGGVHLCFQAEACEQVDAFHAAAIACGGTCNGAPGMRPEYHPGYYAAFVLDPDGNNIELVFRDWELLARGRG